MRRKIVVLVVALGALGMTAMGSGAQGSFANPAFQTQWQQGETLAPNFWGPVATAKDGQNEAYVEGVLGDGQTGKRLVQYFDKARMELTKPATNSVTSGLLASDLFKGQIQVGDAAFQPKAPPAVPIAGDPDNPGPTYAGLSSKGASLFAFAATKQGAAVTLVAAADGTVTDGGSAPGSAASPTIGAYDATTQHNVLSAFATYRDRVGITTIGYAISEPFRANLKVAGSPVTVLVQVFERRVLTYTATNPDLFKVEMGNIGQHYYKWRYDTAATPTATTTATAPAAPSTTPTATPGAVTVTFIAAPGAHPANSGSVTIKTTAGASCTLDYRLPGETESVRQGKVMTAGTDGMVTWFFGVGGNDRNPASKGQGLETVTCNGVVGTQSVTIG